MSTQFVRAPASRPANAGNFVDDLQGVPAVSGGGEGLPEIDDPGPLNGTGHDEIARDIAAIEHATEVLRRAEPALDVWTQSTTGTAPALGQPRPVWLLIGVLWISAALVTLGAVVTIAALAG
jgi:hypothetical protein